ncbi:MAG: efflux RND transporter periplasmic adaptor subunit [Candidatus Hydrogenedentes bacterium]|nr:efflux RND transporter periplasmic adaptor subunit [Candidatus Hydrogenedentota bacterium]
MKFTTIMNIYLILIFMQVFCFIQLAGCDTSKALAQKDSKEEAFPVKTTTVSKRTFKKTVLVQGNIDTKEHAVVSARIDGVLTDLFVDKGDEVIANQTPLFQVDKVKVEQALGIAKQDLAVAKAGLKQAEANLASMQAQFEKAKVDYERFQRLYEKKAVSKDALELQETRYKATKAGLEHAEALLQLAQEQLKKAEYAVKIAEKTYSDSLVYAPISGKVSYKFIEKNEFVGGGRPVLKIDNPTVLEACAFLPVEVYSSVELNRTVAKLYLSGREIGDFPITYKSPTVLPTLRTFEVKVLITNPVPEMIPGTMIDVEVILEERQNLGVPKESVVATTTEKYVFKSVDNKALKTLIETGFETDGWVEVISGELREGDKVISMGQNFIKDGQTIQILSEE